MMIKEAEERTGLTRSNIRFYEKEKLIEPSRNDQNGYREYSEEDIEKLKKIAFLRTLEICTQITRVSTLESHPQIWVISLFVGTMFLGLCMSISMI